MVAKFIEIYDHNISSYPELLISFATRQHLLLEMFFLWLSLYDSTKLSSKVQFPHGVDHFPSCDTAIKQSPLIWIPSRLVSPFELMKKVMNLKINLNLRYSTQDLI